MNLPWSRWIPETIELTLEPPNSWLWKLNQSLAVPEHEWIPLIHLWEYWETLKPHLTHKDSICESDSWEVWAYFDSLSMIWVYPFPTNLALSWPDLGRITHLDSMIFAWSSLDSRLRDTGSYTSWPTLLNAFSIASLTSFSEYPWRWSSWSSSLWSLLTECSLTSKIPCLSDVIMLISDSGGGCLPVICLRRGWGSPAGWGIPGGWGIPWSELLAPSAEGTEDAPWAEDSWRQEHPESEKP